MDEQRTNHAGGHGRRELRWALLLAGTLLLLLAASCSKDDSPTAPVIQTPASLVSQGWARFEQGNMGKALEEFEAALAQDASYGPAHLGKAWCLLTQAGSRENFLAAASSFGAAIAQQETTAAVFAGRAATYLALGDEDLAQAVVDAHRVLASAPAFRFAHRPDFNATDVRSVLACAEAGRGNFAAALEVVQTDYPINVVADDPSTWLVAGVHHESYASAVLAWLQQIGNVAGP